MLTGCSDPSLCGTLRPSLELQRIESVVEPSQSGACSHGNIQQRPVLKRLRVLQVVMARYRGEPSSVRQSAVAAAVPSGLAGGGEGGGGRSNQNGTEGYKTKSNVSIGHVGLSNTATES